MGLEAGYQQYQGCVSIKKELEEGVGEVAQSIKCLPHTMKTEF